MSTSPVTATEPPIIGPDGNVVIAVDNSVSFQWVPAPGDSYVLDQGSIDWDTGAWQSSHSTGSSGASGYVTFEGVSSSEPFQAVPSEVEFSATDSIVSVDLSGWALPDLQPQGWSYNPATGVLDPNGLYDVWNDSIWLGFSVNEADGGWYHWDTTGRDTEYGQWQLVPDIHNVDVFGGVGNDTILGGQGTEGLFGGDGNDLIRAGIGSDLVHGGTGNDELFGGIGKQTVIGGTGNDTIWGGSGAQLLIGGDGQDMIHAGSGPQTLLGGVGNATLWGGSGSQVLEGGQGSNVLLAGSANETLSGGTGRNTFVFSTASAQDVITNLRGGKDIIEIASGFGGLTLVHPQDLVPHISANASGDAVLTVGSGFRLALQHTAATQVELHPSEFFKLS